MPGSESAHCRSSARSASVPARYPWTLRWLGPKTSSCPRSVKYAVACSSSERACGGLAGATTAIVALSGQRGGLDAGHAGTASGAETAATASAISSDEAWSDPSTSSTCRSATCSRLSGPSGSNHSATPVHSSRIA